MTRKSQPTAVDWRKARAFGLRAVLVIGLVFPGFVPLGPDRSEVHAQQAAEPADGNPPADENPPFSLAYIPRDAVAVFAIRPASLLAHPTLAPYRDALSIIVEGSVKDFGLQLEETAELILMVLPNRENEVSGAVVVRTVTEEAVQRVIKHLGPGQRESYAGQTYTYLNSRLSYFQPDNRTLVFSFDEPTTKRCIAAGTSGPSSTQWAITKWSKVAKQDAVAVVNTSLLRCFSNEFAMKTMQQERQGFGMSDRNDVYQLVYRLAPLWQRSEYVVGELFLSPQIGLRVVSQSASKEEAAGVFSAARTALSLIRVRLSTARHAAASQPESTGLVFLKNIDLIDEILENSQVEGVGTQVGLLARVDTQTATKLAAMLVPTALAARDGANQTRSANNLKKIAIAFHNYHDTYRTFPSAIQIGPKNIPHSWRVTLLPFLEEGSLYEEYRQDEPWDSEHNLKLVDKMPDVFRCPNDRRDSMNTSYFALVGNGTVFEGTRPGRLASITDGSSNTILVVESKREVPWTKPEDIPFDPDGPLPALGGWYPRGMSICLCDGSTHLLPIETDPEVLKFLILRADGHPIPFLEKLRKKR